MDNDLIDALAIELAYCRHTEKSVTETANRIASIVERKHLFWRPGDVDCPREIKAGNGELHTLRCKVCGRDNPADNMCIPPDMLEREISDGQ